MRREKIEPSNPIIFATQPKLVRQPEPSEWLQKYCNPNTVVKKALSHPLELLHLIAVSQ